MPIEPGSIDIPLEQLNIRVGGIKFPEGRNPNDLWKFVLIEDFADLEGMPIIADVFDARVMCYSLFVGPEGNAGRHYKIPAAHPSGSKRGAIVGGGLLRLKEKTVSAFSYSSDFGAEPETVRLAAMRKLAASTQRTTEKITTFLEELNPYWFRYAAVLKTPRDKRD